MLSSGCDMSHIACQTSGGGGRFPGWYFWNPLTLRSWLRSWFAEILVHAFHMCPCVEDSVSAFRTDSQNDCSLRVEITNLRTRPMFWSHDKPHMICDRLRFPFAQSCLFHQEFRGKYCALVFVLHQNMKYTSYRCSLCPH